MAGPNGSHQPGEIVEDIDGSLVEYGYAELVEETIPPQKDGEIDESNEIQPEINNSTVSGAGELGNDAAVPETGRDGKPNNSGKSNKVSKRGSRGISK